MNLSVRTRHAGRGFSMVELLVTVVLAGIIFAAMVPVFANALKRDVERQPPRHRDQHRPGPHREDPHAQLRGHHRRQPERPQRSPTDCVRHQLRHRSAASTYARSRALLRRGSTCRSTRPSGSTVSWSGCGPDRTTVHTVVMDPAAEVTGTTPTPTAHPAPVLDHRDQLHADGLGHRQRCDTTDGRQGRALDDDHAQRHADPSPQVPNATNALTVSWTGLDRRPQRRLPDHHQVHAAGPCEPDAHRGRHA